MAKTYTQGDEKVVAQIAAVMKKHRPDLTEAGVTVSALMVGGGLKHHGYAAHAVVNINSLKDRVEGKADCTIQFDDDESGYDSWPSAQRTAILHHELYHLELVRGSNGNVEKDDVGRPKLTMRLHDVEIGGFEEVIKAHGEAAPEAQQIANAQKFVQGLFKF